MITPEYNHKHITLTCPECKTDEILYDAFREETYCTHCGLVLQDNTIFKITRILDEEQEKNKQLNRLWRKVHNINIFKKIRRDSTK